MFMDMTWGEVIGKWDFVSAGVVDAEGFGFSARAHATCLRHSPWFASEVVRDLETV